MSAAEASHLCQNLVLSAKAAAKKVGVKTSEYWSMVAAHNAVMERGRD